MSNLPFPPPHPPLSRKWRGRQRGESRVPVHLRSLSSFALQLNPPPFPSPFPSSLSTPPRSWSECRRHGHSRDLLVLFFTLFHDPPPSPPTHPCPYLPPSSPPPLPPPPLSTSTILERVQEAVATVEAEVSAAAEEVTAGVTGAGASRAGSSQTAAGAASKGAGSFTASMPRGKYSRFDALVSVG